MGVLFPHRTIIRLRPAVRDQGGVGSSALYSTRTTSTDCLAVWLPLVRSTPTIGEMSE